jgi:hypothetical protein
MQKIEVYWRDIPAQILVKSGRVRGKAMLSHRFQAAIDRAAMRAGKGGSDEYLEDWRRVTSKIEAEGSPQDIARNKTHETGSLLVSEKRPLAALGL